MGFFKHIFNSAKDYLISDYANRNNLSYSLRDSETWISNFSVSGLDEKNDYSSFAYTCINARAEKISEAKIKLYQNQASGSTKPITKHPFYQLYNSVNIYGQIGSQLDYLIATSLDLFGNAYLYYSKGFMDMPNQLIFLPTQNVQPIFTEDLTQIQSYRFVNGSKLIDYSPDEIIHFKILSYANNLIGKSTISAGRINVDTDYYQQIYNKYFYKNDAAIGGTLTAPGKINDDVFKRLDTQIRTKYAGSNNSGKWMILDNGMTAERTSATPREAQTNQNRLQLRDEVLALFKTPKSILGYTDDVNRANAEASMRSYITNTIIPFSKHISNTWTSFIKTNYDERIYFEYDFGMSRPFDEVIREREVNAREKILTIDELREQQGYNPLPKTEETQINEDAN